MYFNQLHQGGIRALIDWDNTIFDNMTLPDDVALADVVDHILYKYGDTPLFTPDPAVVKFYIGRWSTRRLPVWNKYKELLEIDFNPLENYDRTEKTTIDDDGTATHDYSGDDSVTRTGEDKLARTGDDTISRNGEDKLTKAGSETSERDADTTRTVSAFNSSAWQNDSKDTVNDDTTLSFTNRTDTRTYTNLDDKTTYNSTDTRTYTNLKDKTDYNSKDKLTNDLTREINGHVHGNIGVVSSQDMFKQQVEIIPYYDLIDFIATDWHQEFNLYIY